MTVIFNPMMLNQPQSGGDTIQIQGNPVANHGTSSPYAVPEGAQYVSVWSDADFTLSATGLKNTNSDGFTSMYPANTIVEVPNVTSKTVITVS